MSSICVDKLIMEESAKLIEWFFNCCRSSQIFLFESIQSSGKIDSSKFINRMCDKNILIISVLDRFHGPATKPSIFRPEFDFLMDMLFNDNLLMLFACIQKISLQRHAKLKKKWQRILLMTAWFRILVIALTLNFNSFRSSNLQNQY